MSSHGVLIFWIEKCSCVAHTGWSFLLEIFLNCWIVKTWWNNSVTIWITAAYSAFWKDKRKSNYVSIFYPFCLYFTVYSFYPTIKININLKLNKLQGELHRKNRLTHKENRFEMNVWSEVRRLTFHYPELSWSIVSETNISLSWSIVSELLLGLSWVQLCVRSSLGRTVGKYGDIGLCSCPVSRCAHYLTSY